jgi:hypothetical protein
MLGLINDGKDFGSNIYGIEVVILYRSLALVHCLGFKVGIHSLRVGWRNLFPVVSFLVLEGNRFWFYILLM